MFDVSLVLYHVLYLLFDNVFSEASYYEFQPCDGDPMDTISLDHNADIALKNEGQKWFQWFSKECRNLNRLSAQLVRVQAMASEGHRVSCCLE